MRCVRRAYNVKMATGSQVYGAKRQSDQFFLLDKYKNFLSKMKLCVPVPELG